jgi:membrane protease YdiL (CAAX protease family)
LMDPELARRLLALAVGLLMVMVAAGTLHSGLLLRHWTPSFNLLLTWADNVLRLVLIALCVILGVWLGPGAAKLGWSSGGLPTELAWGGLAGLLMTGVFGVAGWLAVRFWGEEIYSNKLVQCILPLNSREWAGVLAALLPAAALEELLFRSLPLAGLAWLLPPWWLLWPLSLFFGLLHWPQGWWGVVGTTLAGIALSLLFLITNSLWAPLAAHYVMNVSQIVLARWSGMRPLRAAPET